MRRRLVVAAALALALIAGGSVLISRQTSDSEVSNGWILYEAREEIEPAEVSSGADIYAVAEGIAPKRVLGAPGDETDQSCPAFSPDGDRLSYIDDGDLVIARMDSGGLSEEARFARNVDSKGPCPRWSPDGSKIAFPVMGGESLRILTYAGGGHRASISGPFTGTGTITDLEWSPDGLTLGIGYNNGVIGVPLAGTRLVRLVSGVYPDSTIDGEEQYDEYSSIAWSTSTGLLAISGHEMQTGDGQVAPEPGSEFIRVANSVGRSLRELAAHPVQGQSYGIAWSPDGGSLGYVDGEAGLRLVGPDGRAGSEGYSVFPASGVAWSPDGRRMVFLVAEPWRLVSVSRDPGEGPVELARSDGLGLTEPNRISWQPLVP